MLESLGEDWEQETAGLARASLSTSHEISSTHDNGNGVFLYRRRSSVASQFDVANEVIVERRVGEGIDRVGDIMTAGFNRDIVIVGKVDASVSLGRIIRSAKQFSLDLWVRRTGDVLPISPLTIS